MFYLTTHSTHFIYGYMASVEFSLKSVGNCVNVSISTKVQTRLPGDQRPTKPDNRLMAGEINKQPDRLKTN